MDVENEAVARGRSVTESAPSSEGGRDVAEGIDNGQPIRAPIRPFMMGLDRLQQHPLVGESRSNLLPFHGDDASADDASLTLLPGSVALGVSISRSTRLWSWGLEGSGGGGTGDSEAWALGSGWGGL